jgi:hypothetical protein
MIAPVTTYRYTLTTADALAWEALPGELRGWRKAAFLLWLASAGAVLAWLPPSWIGDQGDWRFWAVGALLLGVNWLIATGAMTLATHHRARRRIPRPVEVEVEDRGDHLTVRRGTDLAVFTNALVAAALLTDRHLFIHAPPEVLILPLSAFPDREAAAALAHRIDAAGRDPA